MASAAAKSGRQQAKGGVKRQRQRQHIIEKW